jgi:hypothetical protein
LFLHVPSDPLHVRSVDITSILRARYLAFIRSLLFRAHAVHSARPDGTSLWHQAQTFSARHAS